ncbi:MAG TPA: lysylphosphatidylglycerol synthase transmembrane domain-containing protein [Anaerolineales bacterium]|nr:lysylphosphatidylglycerol synthase transmembrane domain-containing protein [Anaerolineales bacterium]
MASWSSRNRQRLVQVAGTILAIVLLVLLIREDGWAAVVAAMKKIPLADLFWVTILFFISRIAVVWRWHVLLRSGGVKIPMKDSAMLTFTGLFASNFLPTTIGGDVLRLAGAMKMGYDKAVCLASIAADRLIGMFGMFMVAPLGLAYSWNILPANPLGASFFGFIQKPLDFIKRTLLTFSIWFQKPGSLLLSLAFTWVHMICLFWSIYIFLEDLGNPVSFWMIAGLWSLTYFITQIPISINGYGLQELTFTFLFSRVAGVPPADSFTVSILIRTYLVIASLPGVFFMPSALAAMTEKQSSTTDTAL